MLDRIVSLLFFGLFLLLKKLWIYFDSRDLLIHSDGGKVTSIQGYLLYDVWNLTMPDGSQIEAARYHWYYLPVVIMVSYIFFRKR